MERVQEVQNELGEGARGPRPAITELNRHTHSCEMHARVPDKGILRGYSSAWVQTLGPE